MGIIYVYSAGLYTHSVGTYTLGLENIIRPESLYL